MCALNNQVCGVIDFQRESASPKIPHGWPQALHEPPICVCVLVIELHDNEDTSSDKM